MLIWVIFPIKQKTKGNNSKATNWDVSALHQSISASIIARNCMTRYQYASAKLNCPSLYFLGVITPTLSIQNLQSLVNATILIEMYKNNYDVSMFKAEWLLRYVPDENSEWNFGITNRRMYGRTWANINPTHFWWLRQNKNVSCCYFLYSTHQL